MGHSGDALTYTFHLREAKWSDGHPVTAQDFLAAFQRVLTPTFAAPQSYMLWPIKNAEAYNKSTVGDFSLVGAKALNSRTLEIRLERPTHYLLTLVAHNAWCPIPKWAIEKAGGFTLKNNRWAEPGSWCATAHSC